MTITTDHSTTVDDPADRRERPSARSPSACDGHHRRLRAGHRRARHAPRPLRRRWPTTARPRRPSWRRGPDRRPLRARVARAAGDRRASWPSTPSAPRRSRHPRVLAARRAPGVPRSTRTAWPAWRRSPRSRSPARASSRSSSTSTATGTGIPFGGYGDGDPAGPGGGPTGRSSPTCSPRSGCRRCPTWSPAAGRPGARVADVGCGCGWSSIAIARAFPRRSSTGSTSTRRRSPTPAPTPTAAGVADRVPFEVRDAADAAAGATTWCAASRRCTTWPIRSRRSARCGDGRHRWRGVRRRRAGRRRPDAPDDPDPMQRFLYAASVLHCLPVGRSEEGSAATGTVMRTGGDSTTTPPPPGSPPSRCSRSTMRCSASTGCGSRHLVTLRLDRRSGHPRSRYRAVLLDPWVTIVGCGRVDVTVAGS